MPEYIETFKAMHLLNVSRAKFVKLSQKYKFRFIKQFTSKLWNMEDLQAVLRRRETFAKPPPGWLRLADVARLIRRSPNITRNILMAAGVTPQPKRIFANGRYRFTPCYARRAIDSLMQSQKLRLHTHPPEGWLTLADVMDYLRVDKSRASYWLRRFNVAFIKQRANRYFYREDDVVAMRRTLRTNNRTSPLPPPNYGPRTPQNPGSP